MKLNRIISALVFVVLLSGCKNKKEDSNIQPIVKDTVIKAKPPVYMGDNSNTSLDWPGTYTGVLPCWEGCEGYKHTLEINNGNTYILWLQQLGQEKEPRMFKGTFTWDATGSVITLDAEGDHLKFKVMENRLKKLDKFGNEEKGAPQERYILSKTE